MVYVCGSHLLLYFFFTLYYYRSTLFWGDRYRLNGVIYHWFTYSPMSFSSPTLLQEYIVLGDQMKWYMLLVHIFSYVLFFSYITTGIHCSGGSDEVVHVHILSYVLFFSYITLGVHCSGGSDAPVEPPNVLKGIYDAVYRPFTNTTGKTKQFR